MLSKLEIAFHHLEKSSKEKCGAKGFIVNPISTIMVSHKILQN
jgi:hypothetical protein